MPDPLLMDVLCDPRTMRHHKDWRAQTVTYMRDGVFYVFTFEEIADAYDALRRRLESTCF